MEENDCISGGKLFQRINTATGNDRRPTVARDDMLEPAAGVMWMSADDDDQADQQYSCGWKSRAFSARNAMTATVVAFFRVAHNITSYSEKIAQEKYAKISIMPKLNYYDGEETPSMSKFESVNYTHWCVSRSGLV